MFKLFAQAIAVAMTSALAIASCSQSTTREIVELENDSTIGAYCDELLPTFCAYAVQVCGVGSSITSCISNSKPACCQRACKQRVRWISPDEIEACKLAYAGTVLDAGTPDANVTIGTVSTDGGAFEAGFDGSTAVEGPVNGLPCSAVSKGVLPAKCQGLIQIANLHFAPNGDYGLEPMFEEDPIYEEFDDSKSNHQ